MPHPDLATRRHWVFDMDGTLTVAAHDFAAIRAELGLAPGEPILETLDAMEPARAGPLYARLDAIEMEVAREARPQPGAQALLDALAEHGRTVGIVTRNGETIAHQTLRCCGLARHFPPAHVVGRESAPPKPAPDGIGLLIDRWGTTPDDTVMVGDFHFDLDAGRRAGALTVYYDADASAAFTARADVHVRSHRELLSLVAGDADHDARGPSPT